ncbi:carbohydrate kinase [Pelagibius sp.]|uniref:carbohydrate kinase family protein n=1 Tax=Pelagibius sp. TaxID=1931238 RepID=UPI0026332E73|nr:carbohydrate kinase [Pelagibius sp.]
MFVVCGEALYDVFTLEETDRGFTMDARIGGSPFNVAIGLARLGCDVAFCAGLSSDPLGRRLERHLEAEGVDTRYVVRKDNPTTLALVALGGGGEPHYSFYGHAAADRAVTSADLPTLPETVQAIHFGSFSLAVEPSGASFLELARHAAEKLVSFDPNIRLNVEPDAALWRQRTETFTQIAALVKVSVEDLNILFPEETPEGVIARWHANGVQLVVVTRGSEGALVSLRGEVFEVPGRRVETVDTVGAGDTYQAALLCGLERLGKASKAGLAALSMAECRRLVDFAGMAAAITCTRRGADMPHAAEVPDI